MHENTFFKKIGTERLKLLAVLLFFLFSGIWYSHSFATGALEIGTPASAEKITEKREISAENDAGRLNINTATAKEADAPFRHWREKGGGNCCVSGGKRRLF